jgi:hypothetical protein
MKSLGQYTLGDEYVSPQNRLSRLLMQQGSQGGPSHSWQETMGRIAQQLSGAYMGMQDQKQQDAYLDARGKTERDSFRSPTDAEAMATPGMRDLELSAMSGIAGDGQGQTVTSQLPDDQLMRRGDIPSIMEKIGRYNQNMGAPGASDDETLQQGLDLQSQKFAEAMNQSREASNVPRPRDFKAELAQGMQDYQQDPNNRIMNDKMPQRDFMIKNLQAMPNNTYAKRGLAQALMQGMDQDYEAGLANTARSQQLDDATLLHNRGMEKDKAQYAMKPPASRESQAGGGLTQNQNWVGGEWANAGDPYDKNFRSPESQKQAMERSTASKQYWNPAVFQEKEEIKENVKSDSYSKKPMPTSAVKLQDEHIAAISTSKGLTADLGKWDKMITSGDLDLGYFSNPLNAAKTYTGVMSDEQSRNYSSFKTSLEKMRNESLRLNKGIQTEGDAQRIWNELISNISDEEFVSQRLKELQAVNQRAVELRKYQIDSIRNNFGKGPMDEAPEPTAIPGTGGASVDFVYIPGQGLVPEKRGK